MTRREAVLRAIRFERPDYIPMTFHINAACWHHYDQSALQDMIEAHPFLFPGFKRRDRVVPEYGLNQRKDAPYADPWGCLWQTTEDGITGSVHQHPLADWGMLSGYHAPDPETTDGTFPVDWPAVRQQVNRLRRRGELIQGGLPHGHTFLRLQDIRGYEPLIFDMLDGSPELAVLIRMVEDFNLQVIQKWLQMEPDIMAYPEDLGMQAGPMLSPEIFRAIMKPVYQRLMAPARDQGCIVHMHSDGDIRTLLADLLDGGVDVINLQDLVNGIDWIAETLAGRVCIDLDVDRQAITPRGTPRQIHDLIRQEVEKLGSRQGGLMLIYGLYPGIPLDNINALMDAMETYTGYYT